MVYNCIGILHEGEGMDLKEKLRHIKEVSLQRANEHKKIVILSCAVVIGILVLIMNMNLIQISYFKMKQMPTQVVNILTKAKTQEYKKLYFKQGLDYLLEDLSEVSLGFLEENFAEFDEATQEKIIIEYNKEGLFFKSQEVVFSKIMTINATEPLKKYVRRLETADFERAVSACLDEQAKLTQDSVDRLYKLLALRGEKLPLEHFKISVFELLNFPHKADVESTSIKILDYIQPERVKEILFTELKTKEVEISELSTWVDILNKKRIIIPSEYISFTNNYGMIKRLQDELKQIELQEVDLMNMKQSVDVQTEVIDNEIQKYTKEIATLNDQVSTLTSKVNNLRDYQEIDLYVLDRYEDGEYEAAIPEKSWLFGTYKPSSQKVRLKTTRTTISKVGVQTFSVYSKGTLDNGVIYYIEVSNEQLGQISDIEKKIQESNSTILNKQNEVDKLNQEIAQIRKSNNYDSTLNLIEELEMKKSNIDLEIEKYKLAIQTLFGIGNITV